MILSNYNFVSKYAILIFTFFLLFSSVQGQILISSGEEITPLMLVENIVGEGVQYSNVQFQGSEFAKGIFTNGESTNIGIDGGIILASGYASTLQGPNNNTGATGSFNTPGDATLTGLAGQSTHDAAVLQFDFVPESDTLRFRYVFGSEEYDDYVFTSFNDVFGYFVSGPDPAGGEYANKNIAVVPGTDPEEPITINSINWGQAWYPDPPPGPAYGVNPEYYISNYDGMTIEYDGFTIVITAFIEVVACETYHIKMAVADAGDGILDSGVLLEENSFESPKIDVQTDPYPQGVSDNMIEGCVEADVIFELPNDSYAPITVDFEIITGPGYAINGTDYVGEDGGPIDPWVTFEEGEDSVAIHVEPIKDGFLEGEELIEFVVTNELGCEIRYDTVTFIITDYVDMVDTISPSTVICIGQEIDLYVSVGNGIPLYTYSWEPEISDNDTITVSPEETTTYTVTIFDLCMDTITDSTTVTVFPIPDIDIGPDSAQICEEDTLELNAGGGYLAYIWQGDPVNGDSTFVVGETSTYTVLVYGIGGCHSSDTMYVERIILNMDIGNDTLICEGDSLVLSVQEGFDSYEWQDGSSELTMIAKDEGWYSLIVTGDGCSKKDSIYLLVDDPSAAIELGDDLVVCENEYVTIGSSTQANSYLWSTGDTTATISVTDPNLYILNAEMACGSSSDTILISNWPYPDPNLGNDTLLCEGDYMYLEAESGFASYSWNNEPPTSNNDYLVSETNYYYVQVEDYHECPGYDTVFIEIGNEVELGPGEMTLCEGDSIILDAGSGFDFYNWNGVPGSQTMAIYQGGIFIVDVGYYDNDQCESDDEVTINYFNLPVAEITSEEYFCTGESMDLTAPPGEFSYYWNDDQTDKSLYTIDEGGLYRLKMENICGADSTEKDIEQHELPGVNLGEDQLLFPDGSITLDAGVYETYEWNDDPALNNQFLTINANDVSADTATVYVEVFDGYCYNKDGVYIEIFNVKIPTVITPNGDGDNDLFAPFEEGWAGIHNHTITVFNRWGEQVWESNDFPAGWDGKQNGNLVSDGTYFWVLDVQYGPQNLSKSYKGTLSVLGTGK